MEIAIIIDLIANGIDVINLANENGDDTEFIKRKSAELNGMLICLKNIDKSDRHYVIEYNCTKYEFGYYLDNEFYPLNSPLSNK